MLMLIFLSWMQTSRSIKTSSQNVIGQLAAFINVGTGIFLARGNAVEVNGQALVFVLHEFCETASLEGRQQSVTFNEVCVPDALKGLVDLSPEVSVFGVPKSFFCLQNTYTFLSEMLRTQDLAINVPHPETMEICLCCFEFSRLWMEF